MASRKRPPLPDVVHLAWFWCEPAGEWSVDYPDSDPKTLRGMVSGSPHRHRFSAYRIVAQAVGKKRSVRRG